MEELYLRPDQLGHEVRAACPLPGFQVLLVFATGERRVLDMRPFIEAGPAFAPLRDQREFDRIAVEEGAVAWGSGAAIDPDVAYWRSVPAARSRSVADS